VVNFRVALDDGAARVLIRELQKRGPDAPVKRAVVRGINDASLTRNSGPGGSTPLQIARAAIFRQAQLRKRRINQGTKIRPRDKANRNQTRPNLQIYASQQGISLTSYNAAVRGRKGRKSLTVQTNRGGSRQSIPRAFKARGGRNQSEQVFQRQLGAGRTPIRRLSGLSMGAWLTTQRTERLMRRRSNAFVPVRVGFHLQRELNGVAEKARRATARARARNRRR